MMGLLTFACLLLIFLQLNKDVSGPRSAGVIGDRGSRESEYRTCIIYFNNYTLDIHNLELYTYDCMS